MSTLKTTNLQNPSAGSPAIVLASGGTATAQLSSINGGPLAGSRNRIINGDMRIDQRNAGASVTLANTLLYSVDRWYGIEDTDGGATLQRSTVAPTKFTNSLLYTVTSADTSLSAAQYTIIAQAVEGFNVADLDWGTANAQSITISFWVRSSLTGTFGGAINNSASTRSYPFTYSVNAANTWEQKTITIAGDTSGTWLSDNGRGITLNFGLGVGSTFSGTTGAWATGNFVSATGAVSVVGTNGATFYITGVQLEAGSVATPFERRSYGQELALCQRYYSKGGIKIASGTGSATSGTIFFKQEMRVVPTIVYGTSPQGAASVLPSGNDWVSTSEAAPYTTTSSLNCSYTASAEL